MNTDSAIFIFTKDRPELLNRLLHDLSPLNTCIVVVDDSFKAQVQTKDICQLNNVIHFGRKEQNETIRALKLTKSPFVKVLGDGQWNLGHARNFALFYSKIHRFKKILFLDDDLRIPYTNVIVTMFEQLERNNFVGAKIEGMRDDSILGHIAADFEIGFEEKLSGGCLAFKSCDVSCHFLNIYNEDWIWQYLNNEGKQSLQCGEVFQELFDPYLDFNRKSLFQEFGEVVVEGLDAAQRKNELAALVRQDFWAEVLQNRLRYIAALKEKSEGEGISNHSKILSWLLENYPEYTTRQLALYFVDFNKHKYLFQELFDSI